MSRELWKVCENEFFPRRLKIRSHETKRQYRYAIDSFGESMERPATIDDLNDDQVTLWLSKLLDQQLSLFTVREKLGRVLSLWRWCAARKIVDHWPTVQSPDPPEIMPLALREEQLRRLFDSAQKERGTIDGIHAALWWTSHLGFMFCTSERKSAALAVEIRHLDLNYRTCYIPASERKGRKKPAVYMLWPELIPMLYELIAANASRQLVWPWPYSVGCYYHRWSRIAVDAGLPDDRKHKSHSLRVSHATWRQVAGGDATRQLMHSDPAVTKKFYIDPRCLPQDETRLFIPWSRQPPPGPDRWAG